MRDRGVDRSSPAGFHRAWCTRHGRSTPAPPTAATGAAGRAVTGRTGCPSPCSPSPSPPARPCAALAEIAARTAIAAVFAVVANVIVRALGIALFDIPDEFEHLALRAVILSTLIGVVAAGLVYAVIARFAARPDRTFTIVAVVALLLSLLAPLMVGLEDPPEYPG